MLGSQKGNNMTLWMTPFEIEELDTRTIEGLLYTSEQETNKLKVRINPGKGDNLEANIETDGKQGYWLNMSRFYYEQLRDYRKTRVLTRTGELVVIYDAREYADKLIK